jgi:hypothetical protein
MRALSQNHARSGEFRNNAVHVLFSNKVWGLSSEAWEALGRFGARGSIRSAQVDPAVRDALTAADLIEERGPFHRITSAGRTALNARRRRAA